jgi:putative molybdopterin biosynthesis protein
MKEKRQRYLHNVTVGEAGRRFLERDWPDLGEETLPVSRAVGRVTAQAVFARLSSPHYHAAAMDGVAVRARDTAGAAEASPKRLRLGEQAVPVDTGMPLPPGFDAVIMAEELLEAGEEVEIAAPVAPWQHVRPVGEDIVATEMLLPAGQVLRGFEAGALLAGGVDTVSVRLRPRVVLIPTGHELVPPGTIPAPGQVIEYNSTILSALVAEWGGEATVHEVVADNLPLLREVTAEAARNYDVVLIIAGSSAGRRDYTAEVVAALGEVLVHGVAVRPGKPVILGRVAGKPAMGVPGYPVSAVVALELFLRPLLYRLQGCPVPARPLLPAVFSRQLVSTLAAEEWVRVKVGLVNGSYVATPLTRGAGVTTSLCRADGVVRIPQQQEGLQAGDKVSVELWRPQEVIDRSVVCCGSHDLTLDVLGDLFGRRYPGFSLSSSPVGSIAGLMALRRGEAHLAGIHLLDEESGEYNIPFLERFLPGVSLELVTLVEREQGLIVAPGNPKKIFAVEDLPRPEVSFVNRQRGAGTRLLLDSWLKEKNISPAAVNGYEREEYTHLAVAAAVSAGSADAGLGVYAAARGMGLGFVPLARERFDLAVPLASLDDERVVKLLEIIRSAEFRAAVAALGGYDVEKTGQCIYRTEEVLQK